MKHSQHKKQNTTSAVPTVALISLGCPKNLVDSEVLIGYLNQAGFAFTGAPEEADAIIVNTCAFIAPAVEEAKETLREMAKFKKTGRCRALICAGCLTQRSGASLAPELPEVDAFIGIDDIPQVHDIVASLLHLMEEKVVLTAGASYLYDHTAPRFLATPPWTAYVKIAEGCHHRCAFCTIPAIRGPFRSRTPESLLTEARDLAVQGVKEIVLIGQDTTAYGRDIKVNLPMLLRQLDQVEGLHWIRLMYGFPGEVSAELLEVIANSKHICHYLDIPLQHAHQRILRAMHRSGDGDAYLHQIETIRAALPDVALRSCFIVGFPGETEQEFQSLLDFLRAAQLDRVGAFVYCREPGTDAAEMTSQVPPELAQERYERLMAIQQEISYQRNQTWIGKELEVLIESEENQQLIGRSYRDAPDIDGEVVLEVKKNKPRSRSGEFITATIAAASEYDLSGKI
jgi:ribosomal protein S12 methylthiotransferase